MRPSLQWRKLQLDAAILRECQTKGMTELEELDGTAAPVFDSTATAAECDSVVAHGSKTKNGLRGIKKAFADLPPRVEKRMQKIQMHRSAQSALRSTGQLTRSRSSRKEVTTSRRRNSFKTEKRMRMQQTPQERDVTLNEKAVGHLDEVKNQDSLNPDAVTAVHATSMSLSCSRSAAAKISLSSSNRGAAARFSAREKQHHVHQQAKKSLSMENAVLSIPENQARNRYDIGRPCSLDECTEQWVLVNELREQLHEWVELLSGEGEEDLLHPAVLHALQRNHFFHPTPIQQSVLLPALRDRKDIVAAAETGSGKTLAYGVPIVCNLLAQLLRRNEKALERNQQLLQQRKRRKRIASTQLCSSRDDVGSSSADDYQTAAVRMGTSTADEIAKSVNNSSCDNQLVASEFGGDNSRTRLHCRRAVANVKAASAAGGRVARQGEVDGPECLVIVPSRELAFQVQQHLQALCIYTPIRVVCLVGGLAVQKQQRQLAQLRPQIIVGTPGRLFALLQEAQLAQQQEQKLDALAIGGAASNGDSCVMNAETEKEYSTSAAAAAAACERTVEVSIMQSNEESAPATGAVTAAAESLCVGHQQEKQQMHAFLSHLQTLRFVVLDEADRLMKDGSFEEMDGVLEAVRRATALFVGKAKMRKQQQLMLQKKRQERNPAVAESATLKSSVGWRKSRLQIFILSATLRLEEKPLRSSAHKKHKLKLTAAAAATTDARAPERGERAASKNGTPVPEGMLLLMERVGISASHACIVDLCGTAADTDFSRTPHAGATVAQHRQLQLAQGMKLPERLSVSCLKTVKGEEELYLALLLLKLFTATPPNKPLKVIIFVNAISYVYRLDPVLSLLLGKDKHESDLSPSKHHKGVTFAKAEVLGLHSNLRQRQRLKRMEKFQSAPYAVLVCTDVASRGLDLSHVNYVIQFQAPHSPSIFVHRSGRAARANNFGECVCVCSAAQVDDWLRVTRPLNIELNSLPPPSCMADKKIYSCLPKVKRIFSLVTKVEVEEHRKSKKRRDSSWLRKAAENADIALESDESNEEGEESARNAFQSTSLRLQKAELAQLLKTLRLSADSKKT